MSEQLTADDFFTGLFAALALKGRKTLTMRKARFEEAVTEAYNSLRERADGIGVDVRFRIFPHPFHGGSTTIRDSVTRAAQRDIISFDNPEYQDIRLKLNRENAGLYLVDLPAGPELYLDLAKRFLSSYRE